MLKSLLDTGYQAITVAQYAQRQALRSNPTTDRILVIRHDIDTDTKTARAMWQVESRLGIVATRYFRQCTMDFSLMKEIHQSGGEASYHYEELSSYAKENFLKTSDQVRQRLPEIRARFETNLNLLRNLTGLPLNTVAAHGDFVNRRLQMTNVEILSDPDFRLRMGIDFEAYDIDRPATDYSRHCDRPPPVYWHPTSPPDCHARHTPVLLHLLMHPRHWRADPWGNLKDNAFRSWEGLRYFAGRRWSSCRDPQPSQPSETIGEQRTTTPYRNAG